jgi:hypothetical protein
MARRPADTHIGWWSLAIVGRGYAIKRMLGLKRRTIYRGSSWNPAAIRRLLLFSDVADLGQHLLAEKF